MYQQVTALFRDAPDLLDEFKAFLPDTSGEASQPPPPSASASPSKPKTGMGKTLSQTAARKPLDQGVEKKKRAAPGMGEKSKAKRTKVAHSQQGGLDSPPLGGPSSMAAYKQQQQQQAAMVDPSLPPSPFAPHHAHVGHPHPYGPSTAGYPGAAPHLQSAYDAYLTTHRAPPLVQPEEFGFFDRVKKFLDDRAAYTEFLKLLNLFTQEIIDLPTLLNKSLLFIGSSEELFTQFKSLVGWDPAKDGRVEGEDWIIDNEPVLDRPPVLLHLMKSYGPSYRRLPDSVSFFFPCRLASFLKGVKIDPSVLLHLFRKSTSPVQVDLLSNGRYSTTNGSLTLLGPLRDQELTARIPTRKLFTTLSKNDTGIRFTSPRSLALSLTLNRSPLESHLQARRNEQRSRLLMKKVN